MIWTMADEIVTLALMTSHEHEGSGAGAGDSQPRHPIGVVSTRTGLSADVIRVWERRYAVVDPARDEAGRRLYSDADVERLRLLSQATEAGRGIGQVAALPAEALRELVRADEAARWSAGRPASPSGSAGEAGEAVERALERAVALDGPGLEVELRRAATLLGLTVFLEGVVAPLFRRIGDDWHAGRLSVAQEHLATAVTGAVLARLAGAVADSPAGAPGAPLMVIATPSGEHHEIGALLAAAVVSAAGWRLAYLGPNVPASDIVGAAMETGARAVALSAVYGNAKGLASEVERVRSGLPAAVDLVVGGGAAEISSDLTGVKYMEDLASLRSYLAEII
jgi:MerR family transcriptional regulator, light-induced transcriptional regulator